MNPRPYIIILSIIIALVGFSVAAVAVNIPEDVSNRVEELDSSVFVLQGHVKSLQDELDKSRRAQKYSDKKLKAFIKWVNAKLSASQGAVGDAGPTASPLVPTQFSEEWEDDNSE